MRRQLGLGLLGACLSLGYLTLGAAAHAADLDIAKFIAQRSAEDQGSNKPHSPTPDIAPLVFIDKGAYGTRCGVLVAKPGAARNEFIELTGPEGRESFPDCMGILSLTQFRLLNHEYVAIEYLVRETREEIYRQFAYLVRNDAKGYLVDDRLHGKGEADGAPVGASPKPALGIAEARIAILKKSFPEWQLQERDFISDKTSSFAVFDDNKSQECHIVAEAGAAPATTSLTDYVPGARCASVLASTRFEKSGTSYYLAMFKSDGGKHIVTVTSVARDGKITFEKGLSKTINKSGATGDIKGARTALTEALR